MSDNDSQQGKGFLTGMILGGIIGAAAAYLLGGEDREKAKRILKQKGKLLLDSLDDFGDKVEDVGEEIKELPARSKKFFFKKGKPLAK